MRARTEGRFPGRVAALLLAFATVVPATGCEDAAVIAPIGFACRTDAECSDGLVCDFNHCVVSDDNPLAIKARITPPPSAALLPQQLPSLSLADGPGLLVTLVEPFTVHGVIGSSQDILKGSIEGDLEVRTDGDIAGLDFVFGTHAANGLNTDGYGYTLTLLPGRTYRGVFRPADRSLPRQVFSLSPSDYEDGRFDLVLPARSEYTKLSGRLMKSDYSGIGGARIIVLSAAREVIGVTTSDDLRGYYELLLPPSVTQVQVKAEPPASGPIFPEFSTDLRTLDGDAPVDLIVPDLPTGADTIDAVIRVRERRASRTDGGADEVLPAAGRTVTIVGVLTGGTLRRTGTTDENGEVRFLALPGAYECLVASPPQSAAQTWHGYVNLASPSFSPIAGAVEIELAPRVPFVGHVTDAFGLPVEAGVLTLERRVEWKEDQQLVIAPAPFEAQLGEDGAYVTWVDPGTYDLRVSPDLGTGAPNTFETGLVVGDEGLRFDLGLPLPGLLHLTVAGPSGAWIPGSEVELWADGDDGAPRLLAIGTTGERGFIDIIVPHLGRDAALLFEHLQ